MRQRPTLLVLFLIAFVAFFIFALAGFAVIVTSHALGWLGVGLAALAVAVMLDGLGP